MWQYALLKRARPVADRNELERDQGELEPGRKDKGSKTKGRERVKLRSKVKEFKENKVLCEQTRELTDDLHDCLDYF